LALARARTATPTSTRGRGICRPLPCHINMHRLRNGNESQIRPHPLSTAIRFIRVRTSLLSIICYQLLSIHQSSSHHALHRRHCTIIYERKIFSTHHTQSQQVSSQPLQNEIIRRTAM
jgi:hypothetical protein